MGDYPKSVAAFGDQGDLEFVADRVFADTADPIGSARHGNAVMSVARPFDNGGEVVVCGRPTGCSVSATPESLG